MEVKGSGRGGAKSTRNLRVPGPVPTSPGPSSPTKPAKFRGLRLAPFRRPRCGARTEAWVPATHDFLFQLWSRLHASADLLVAGQREAHAVETNCCCCCFLRLFHLELFAPPLRRVCAEYQLSNKCVLSLRAKHRVYMSTRNSSRKLQGCAGQLIIGPRPHPQLPHRIRRAW